MSYNSVIAADSPVAWWRLDEAAGPSTVADSSGNAHTGTVTATETFGVTSPAPPAGIPGPVSSWASNGTQDIVFTGYRPSLTAASWEWWYNANGTSAGTNPRVLADSLYGSTLGFNFLLLGKTKPSLTAGNGASSSTITATSALSAGWHHIAGTYDGSNLRLYVDGASAATAVAFTGTIGPNGTNDVHIGGNFPWEAHDPFSGLLCQVALYSAALSAARITAHYNAGITAAVIPSLFPGRSQAIVTAATR